MMQASSMPTGPAGLLSQIQGGLDERGAADSSDGGEFVQSIASQIKSRMLQRGDDPAEVAAIDDEALVAQFFAFLQGQIPASASGLSAIGLFGEMMGGAGARSDAGELDTLGSESDVAAGLVALPAVVLDRLGESVRTLSSQGAGIGSIETADSTSLLISDLLPQSTGRDSEVWTMPSVSTASTETSSIGGRLQTLDLSRLLQPGGETRLGEQVRWSVENGLDTAEIRLHPPSLGTLDIRIVQDADKTHVQFVSAHPVAREVLEAAIPRLREALAQDGVVLGNVSVSDQAPNDRGETGRDRRESDGAGDRETEDDEERIESRSAISALARRLDVFT